MLWYDRPPRFSNSVGCHGRALAAEIVWCINDDSVVVEQLPHHEAGPIDKGEFD